jgi:FkbM family methyltransferase
MTATCAPNDAIRSLIAELRKETAAQIVDREHAAWRNAAGDDPRGMLIFGCGQLGRFVLPGVRAAGLEPLAFCDNNPQRWGREIDGLPVMGPAEALRRFGAGTPILTAIYNAGPVQQQLRELGCTRVLPYPLFFWEHSSCLPAEERLDLPHRIAPHADDIEAAFELLADDKSRKEYLTQIRWRFLLDYACLPPYDSPSDMYFAPDLFDVRDDEVLVDCGAFDGDSIRLFLDRTRSSFRKIYAFEPDAQNISALKAFIAALPPEQQSKIDLQPFGVGREKAIVRFSADGSVGSKINDAGTAEIEIRALDAELAGCEPRPTLIKMDIEGAEIDAIPGAAQIAAGDRPIFAVCAYHHCSDLWTIPALLKAANPDYRIALRRYAEECWETVFYAIPPERWKSRCEE